MTTPQSAITRQPDSPMAIIAMILGVLSLMGPGLLLGIPAIILAAIALKKKAGGKGLAVTGLVTGIISTVVSLIVIGLFLWFVSWAAENPEQFKEYERPYPQQNELPFEGLQT